MDASMYAMRFMGGVVLVLLLLFAPRDAITIDPETFGA
jgi:hypothetical protein